jgi:hypothetical protein
MDLNELFKTLFEEVDKKLATHDFVKIIEDGGCYSSYQMIITTTSYFKCKKCGYVVDIIFNNKISAGSFHSLQQLMGVLSCDEYIIKDIIE